MQIKLIEQKGSYGFYLDEKMIYKGEFSGFFGTKYKLLNQEMKLVAQASTKGFSIFKPSCKIILRGRDEIIISKKAFSSTYTMQYKNAFYEFYAHNGRKTSIYKNDYQIGFFEIGKFEWLDRLATLIVLDNDVDTDLLLISIMISMPEPDFDSSTLSVNLGNRRAKAKKFDSTWKPKLFIVE